MSLQLNWNDCSPQTKELLEQDLESPGLGEGFAIATAMMVCGMQKLDTEAKVKELHKRMAFYKELHGKGMVSEQPIELNWLMQFVGLSANVIQVTERGFRRNQLAAFERDFDYTYGHGLLDA